MSGGTTIQITGLEELKRKFKGLPANVEAGIDAELDTVANEYQNRAHNAAPTDRGQLRNQILAAKTGELSYEVVSHMPYSAYVEFGTRSRVQVPSGLAAYAAQFRAKGAKGDAKKAIYDWCKRVGNP
jgi:HK97 gp10 family phage protein